jgi:phosphohistidine phosphatase
VDINSKNGKMKTLIIVRHAKSSWANADQTDFERPLNDRGNRDAPEMAKRLLDKKININHLVSSTAKRAMQTCVHFSKILNIAKDEIQKEEILYHSSSETIHYVVGKINNDYDTVTVFCHNPGITDFVNTLLEEVKIDDMPTCGVFAVKADIADWKEFYSAEKEFMFFDYPKLNV